MSPCAGRAKKHVFGRAPHPSALLKYHSGGVRALWVGVQAKGILPRDGRFLVAGSALEDEGVVGVGHESWGRRGWFVRLVEKDGDSPGLDREKAPPRLPEGDQHRGGLLKDVNRSRLISGGVP